MWGALNCRCIFICEYLFSLFPWKPNLENVKYIVDITVSRAHFCLLKKHMLMFISRYFLYKRSTVQKKGVKKALIASSYMINLQRRVYKIFAYIKTLILVMWSGVVWRCMRMLTGRQAGELSDDDEECIVIYK